MAVLQNNILAGAAGQTGGAAADFKIDRSLRFNSGDSSHLYKDFAPGNITKWTWSGWVKRSGTGFGFLFQGGNTDYNDDGLHFNSSDQLAITFHNGSNAVNGQLITSQKFKDISSWYHIVMVADTSNNNGNERMRLYVNGLRVTELATNNNPDQHSGSHDINRKFRHNIGSFRQSSDFFNGYLADVHFLDAQTPSTTTDDSSGSVTGTPNAEYLTDFGEFDTDTGIWKPKDYTHSGRISYSDNGQITIDDGNYYLNGLDGPNAFNADGFTYIDSRLGSGSNSTSNIIWQPTGGIQNVTKIRVHTNYATHYRINNGTWTSFSSSGTYAQIYSGSAFTLTKLEIRRDNCQASDWGHRVTFYEINDVEYRNVGTNSFHLDFSDNSDSYKLGKDAASTDTALPCVDFDGNDHLQVAYHSDINLSSNDFTIECYAKTTDASTNYPSIVGRWKQNGEAHWDFRPASDDASHNFFFIYHTGSANISVNSGTSITDGKWHHLAVARDGSNLRMFVDGRLVKTHNIGTTGISNSTNVPLYLGYDPYGSSYYNGQTSNLRIVTGTALYTASFTKPTLPLTNVTGTKLLCFQSDTSVTAAAVTPNSLTVSSGDPEARSVSDSDWTVSNISVSDVISSGNGYNGSLNGYMPAGVTQATDPSQLASTSNRTHFFLVNQDNSLNLTVVATATSMTVGSSVYDSWGSNNPTTTLNNGATTPSSSGTDTSVSGKTLATNTFNNLTIGDTYTISTKNGGAGNPHRIHYVTGATVQNQPIQDTDSVFDSPVNYDDGTNIGGNYSTWNPLSNGLGGTLANGNLDLSGTSGLNTRINSTIGVSSGKWYYEVVITALTSSSAYSSIGIGQNNITNKYPGYDALSYAYHVENNYPIHNDTNGSNIGGNFAAGDTLMVAFDLDNNKLYFGKNGTWLNSGNPVTGANPVYTIAAGTYHAIARPNPSGYGSGAAFATNFGARGFSYAPPTGFKALCTQNFDDPLIKKGSDHFDVKTYSGNGGTQTISGLSFRPSLVWVKRRDQALDNILFDAIRGFGANKELVSNDNYSEGATGLGNPNTDVWGYVDDVTNDGFVVEKGSHSTGAAANTTGGTYVGWVWNGGNFNNTFNSSTHDQSQLWSSLATLSGGSTASGKGLGNGFDGTTTTATEGDSNNEYLELPISTTIASGGVRVYAAVTSSNPLYINLYNGSSNVQTITGSNSGGQWYATTYAGPITKIRIERGGRPFEFNAVEVNGKILTDAGLTTAGSLNSSFYDQTQNWTSLYTTSSGSMQNSGGSFDGNTSTQSYILNATATWEVSTAFTVTDKVEIFFNNGTNTDFFITSDGTNWTEVTGIGGATGWRTVMNSGSFKGFRTTQSDATNTAASVKAVRIDGKLLVDSGVSLSGLTQYPSTASTVLANQTAGFSILTFTGTGSNATIAHGLNAKPDFYMVKRRNSTDDWECYHSALGATYYGKLNATDVWTTAGSTVRWNDTEPTNNVFSVGTSDNVNGSNSTYVAYVMSAVKGYSAFGEYDGGTRPFVYTGMRPAWVMIKRWYDTGESWVIYDTQRNPHNNTVSRLYADLNNQENDNTGHYIDILSNGFKVESTGGLLGASGDKYLYVAFAENPFQANGGLAR